MPRVLAFSPASPPEEMWRGAVKTLETLKGGGRERRKGEKMRFLYSNIGGSSAIPQMLPVYI
jgi:hypothetical protein